MKNKLGQQILQQCMTNHQNTLTTQSTIKNEEETEKSIINGKHKEEEENKISIN